FSAGNGDASAGFFIKINILKTDFNDFIGCFFFSLITESLSGTVPDAGQTSAAAAAVNLNTIRSQRKCLMGTCVNTGLTVQAFFSVVKNLHFTQLRFRVCAPFAFQWTSFQENGGPDAWAVMDAEFLYIKDNSFG